MTIRRIVIAAMLAALLPTGHAALAGTPQSATAAAPAPKETQKMQARGTFDVKLTPQKSDEGLDESLGRMTITKQLHGGIEGTSTGVMLTGGTAVAGSGVYVAIEKVTGSVDGRKGTFLMRHVGVMTRGAPQLSITVVPDSGTDELVGLEGSFDVIIEDGKHSYVFDYSLPGAH